MAEIKIKADSNGGTVSLKGPATTTGDAAIQLTLPQNDGDANQYLKTDGSGALSFADVSSVGGATGVDFNDTIKARWGTGNDLEIHHTSNNSTIKNATGSLYLNSDVTELNNAAASATMIQAEAGGAVKLFHNGTQVCLTSANGLKMITGKGIDFSANDHSAGMENEVLDDYERGTWTPQFAGGSTNFTQSVSQGFYTKIGNLVYAFWNVAWSDKNSATSTMKLTGFPFTSKSNNGQYYYLGQNTGAWTVDSYDDVAWQVMLVGNGTTADYLGYQPGSGNTLQASELPATGRHTGNIVYPT